jgi:hypothetical protein
VLGFQSATKRGKGRVLTVCFACAVYGRRRKCCSFGCGLHVQTGCEGAASAGEDNGADVGVDGEGVEEG